MNLTALRTQALQLGRRLTNEHRLVADECTQINTKRLLFSTPAASAACLIPILGLLFTRSGSDIDPQWRFDILAVNAVTGLFLLAVFFILLYNRKAEKQSSAVKALPLITAGFFLLFSVSGTLIDQMANHLSPGNVSSFLLACMSIGAVLLLRPLTAAALFTGAYALLMIAGSIFLSDEQLFLLRANGLICVCISTVVSTILWRSNCINLLQSRQLKAQKNYLERMAYNDSLTGLTNRCFFDTLVQQKQPADGARYTGALLMLDLDDFKRVNDTHGHPSGDAVLQQLAKVLQETLRKTDIISRFGGEEFMVLLPETSMEEAITVAEKLRMSIARTVFLLPNGVQEHTTVSIGVASISEGNPYINVDQALYKAKRQGKNNVACHWESAIVKNTD